MISRYFVVLAIGACLCASTKADKVDDLFAQDPHEPGCAVGYSKNGEIQFVRGYGTSNLEHGVPISDKTRFHIASVSKEFTAAAIGMLVLEGKIKLNDDVRKYLVHFPKFDQVVTIEHLLLHTSGIANHTLLIRANGLDYGNSFKQDETLDMVLAEGLSFEPGSRFQYSSSYLVLGDVIEKVAGMPLRNFLKTRVFDPLGMKDSGLHDDFSLIPNRAEGYLEEDGNWINDPIRFALTGSGGIHMTIRDLLHWDHALRSDKLMKGLAKLLYDSKPVPVAENVDYHFGFFRSIFRGARAFAHSGSYQGTKTLMYSYEPGSAVAISCNRRLDIQKLNFALIDIVSPLSEPNTK